MVPPKQPSGLRRVPSSLSKVSTPPTTTPSKQNKPTKPTKIIQLKLSKALLSRFPQEKPASKPTEVKPSAEKVSEPSPPASLPASTPANSDPDATSVRGGGAEDSKSSGKDTTKDDSSTPKTGEKRELGTGVIGDAQVKPKPVQRKRPRVGENGRIDGRTTAAKAMGYSAGTHKLGPKANQGAINEKLRALDRTPKPCRKWQKTGFKIKSFTGRTWEVPTWRTKNARLFGAEAGSQKGTSNDLSKDNSSSNVGSDKSPAGENPKVASSPVAIAPAPA